MDRVYAVVGYYGIYREVYGLFWNEKDANELAAEIIEFGKCVTSLDIKVETMEIN